MQKDRDNEETFVPPSSVAGGAVVDRRGVPTLCAEELMILYGTKNCDGRDAKHMVEGRLTYVFVGRQRERRCVRAAYTLSLCVCRWLRNLSANKWYTIVYCNSDDATSTPLKNICITRSMNMKIS